jgi:hypothetical protein
MMDLPVIPISKDEARAKLAEYQDAVLVGQDPEDAAIMAGYRAAARGHGIISLQHAIASGGFDPDGLPRLAVCRATATQCFVRWNGYNGTDVIFSDRDDWSVNRGALVGKHSVRVPIPGDARPASRGRRSGGTIVPPVPPRHRPHPRTLKHCHVLWEVESWDMVPPVDPALIRHIRGDLWAVLAVWDLTDLERLVLAQRAR